MKQYRFFVWLLALVGLATSCSQDDDFGGQQNRENNRVVITASADMGIETSLKSGPQTRAASGDLQLTGYSLRYILEVWDENNAVAHREEKLVTDASQTVTFDFNLVDAGDYSALLWADYVADGATLTGGHYTDLYYTTNSGGLKAISIIHTAYAVNKGSRDAFFGNISFTKVANSPVAIGSVTLTRPFGRINIIEKEVALLTDLTNMNLAYSVPSTFNVADGTVSDTYSVSLTGITSFPDAATEKANLFFDYIFAPASGQHLLGEMAIDYTHDGNDRSYTIPANMPVERNKRTNISGDILRNNFAAGLSVEIDDAWSGPDVGIIDNVIAVGSYYYEDGRFSSQYAAWLTCLGVVFETDGTHGKIVSLDEANLAWSTDGLSVATASNQADGLANMAAIVAFAGDFTDYPAFAWVDAKNPSGTTYTSGQNGIWYLPADFELKALYAGYSGKIYADMGDWDNDAMPGYDDTETVNSRSAFNDLLTAAGGTAFSAAPYYLWSSFNINEIYARTISFGSGQPTLGNKPDNTPVRAIMAF